MRERSVNWRAVFAFVLICIVAFSAHAEPPFIAAYVHLSRVVDREASESENHEAIAKSIASAKRSGLTVLMPYASSSSGIAYYPSSHHPESLYGEWDALGAYIEAARDAGIVVYPSVPVMTSGHDRPVGILKEHPDWALRDEDGSAIGYISAANRGARQWVVGMLRELVARYELNGLLLDYLRFPNRPVDLDPMGEEEYREAEGGAEFALTDRGDTPWQTFKEDNLTVLMAAIRGALPDTKLALYCWGPHVTKGHYVGQRWDLWAKRGYVDIINVSGYCYTENYGDRYMDAFRERLEGARALIKPGESGALFTFCLGVKTSHGAIKSSSEIDDYLRVSREAGMNGVAVFTLNALEAHLDDVVDAGYMSSYRTAIE